MIKLRYLIRFSYDGTNFKGYQKQEGYRTIQEELEKAALKINDGKSVVVKAAGRTDKGVHAYKQMAHFDLDVKIKEYSLKKLLNKRLQQEVYVNFIMPINDNFHARYDCLDKTYKYFINTQDFDLFKRNYCWQYCQELDLEKMQKASQVLIGTHDFTLLCKNDPLKENTIRTIKELTITNNSGLIEITIKADGFLRKMVRNIVGLLVEVGSGRMDASFVANYLDKSFNKHNRKVAPSCGLYLASVNYKMPLITKKV